MPPPEPIRILVVDDLLARDSLERKLLLQRSGILDASAANEACTKINPVITVDFISGQILRDGRLENDLEGVVDTLRHGCDAGQTDWNLVLLDVQFDSGELDDYGLPSGQPGDAHFGSRIWDRLANEFENLHMVFFTSKAQSELLDPSRPFVSKDDFGQLELRHSLLKHARLSAGQKRALLQLGPDVIAESTASVDIFRKALIHARNNIEIVLLGETGTGKEVLANYIHAHSPRAKGPFIGVNVSAIPAGLAESFFFGAERGAFSGAFQATTGVFEQADGGTLFLDEIGDMALDLQSKVLRVLQERKFRKLGGKVDISVDVRIVSATHKPLATHVQCGMFRDDLWMRLSAVVIELPPLRERKGDVSSLARLMLRKFSAEFNKNGVELGTDAVHFLESHPFPGNIRQLNNLMRSVVSSAGHKSLIQAGDLLNAITQASRDSATKSGDAKFGTIPQRVATDPDKDLTPDSVLRELDQRRRHLDAERQQLLITEIELMMTVLESTRSVQHGKVNRKEAYARLFPSKAKYSTNDFDRALVKLLKSLDAMHREGLASRFHELANLLLRNSGSNRVLDSDNIPLNN